MACFVQVVSMNVERIRVGIADDHAVVRAGLRELLRSCGEFEVVGEANDGSAALDMVRTMRPHVLLLDLAMRPQNGMEAIGRIRAIAPSVGILIFSGYPAAHYARRLLHRGAAGYLDKGCEPEEVLRAIRSVAAGGRYVDAVTGEPDTADVGTTRAPHEKLSPREFQIFLRLAGGLTVGDIAKSISVSPLTVSAHRRRVSEKMGIATGSQFMRYALAHGLLR